MNFLHRAATAINIYFLMKSVLLLLACLAVNVFSACDPTTQTATFSYKGATAVKGLSLDGLSCVKDTQIDFNFPMAANGETTVTESSGVGYKRFNVVHDLLAQSNSSLTLQFLNRDGKNKSYTLSSVSLTALSAGAHIGVDAEFPYAATDLKGKAVSLPRTITDVR